MPTVRTNDVETYYERRGEGPPVVFAHGGTMDHRWWEPQVEAFADEYEVVTYDVRGHGRTGGSSWPLYTMELYAIDLRSLVDELGLDRPVVVGHSLGGMFAVRYAELFPGNLRGLVLADAQVAADLTWTHWLLNNVVIPAQMAATRVVGQERASEAIARVAKLVIDDGDTDEDDLDDDLVAYAEETDEMVTEDEQRKMMAAVRRFGGVDLPAIDVPTLGVYGAESPGIMRENARELDREVPQSTVKLLAGTGHALTRERPEAFNRLLREFLAEEVDP